MFAVASAELWLSANTILYSAVLSHIFALPFLCLSDHDFSITPKNMGSSLQGKMVIGFNERGNLEIREAK